MAIAERWINQGYKKALVLNFVGLAASTYYHSKQDKKPAKTDRKPAGRKKPGYSYNKWGEKITDETIRELLLELVCGDGYPYGYGKLTASLQDDYGVLINHKKVYRLCKELDILRPQRKIYPKRPRKVAKKMEVTGPNQHWQIDLKYGYIAGKGRFFFQISVIDVFDRSVVAYHLGLSATAKDAARVIRNAFTARGLHNQAEKLVIRSDNGPQFAAEIFQATCEELGACHERIPVKSPSMNAYIESFHAILEDDCYNRHEFTCFAHVYKVISEYMDYYNNRRRHGSINNMAPQQYYQAYNVEQPSSKELVA